MFDVGFSELLVIAVVALVVIGPERLPKVARTVGLLIGRMQRYVAEVKSDISQEIQLEELRQSGQLLKNSLQETEQHITGEVNSLHQSISATTTETQSTPAVTHASYAELTENPQAELPLEPMSVSVNHADTDTHKNSPTA